MTRSQESGENEITIEAKREAQRTGRNVCEILAERLRNANAACDSVLQIKIRRAQKYLGCRNIKKRESKK